MSTPALYHLGKFPPRNIDWPALIPLIGQANAALARYDGLLSAIPNSEILLSPLTTQEAVLSSRIEGTVATMGEVLEVEAGEAPEGMTPERREDAFEILNYRKAMRICTSELAYRPLSQHLLRQAHEVLMQGVRGKNKNPGEYRSSQNWIGSPNCPIEKASFVPIPQEHLQTGLDVWEDYLNTRDVLDPLVQLAVVHAEFESLHPFMDGNGRLGRMIVPLFLSFRQVLSGPHFYISAYLDANRDEYLDRLRAVSAVEDWTGWCKFFLEALRTQAIANEQKARAVLALYERLKLQVVKLTHSQHSIRTLDFLFQMPVFKMSVFFERSGLAKPTGTRLMAVLKDEGIVRALREASGPRPALLVFPELMNIVEGRTVF